MVASGILRRAAYRCQTEREGEDVSWWGFGLPAGCRLKVADQAPCATASPSSSAARDNASSMARSQVLRSDVAARGGKRRPRDELTTPPSRPTGPGTNPRTASAALPPWAP